jgi:DNA repair protein RecN (Recombination protein N)
MLVELMVENYAVIERIRVRFHPGLNLLTGETGSGKSIVVDALDLLFGGRSSPEMVRTGAARARIAGLFEPGDSPALRAILERAGVEMEEGELLIEREVLPTGKSRAFVSNRPVTASLLREIAPLLGDIHGQHDQQSLFSPAAQLAMLDAFGQHRDLLDSTAGLYRRWRACAAELEDLDRAEQERYRLSDLWNFQKREIESAALRPGEEPELEQERLVLRNITRLEEAAAAAYSALYDSPSSAEAQLRLAIRRLEDLTRIDAALADTLESLRPALIAVEEAARALQHYLSRLEADPARLEAVEARLAALDKLKRKYGRSVEEILAYLQEITRHIDALEHSTERRQTLLAEKERLESLFRDAASELSSRRRQAARELERAVVAELKALAMENTVFRVEFSTAEWSETGADKICFLVSPNVGEEPKPLDKIASGGEISRIALALKACAAAPAPSSGSRTLVFDEIDSGIGGRAGEAVGRRLRQIAAANQVLCVTHLPQVAAFADHHYSVSKRELDGRTVTEVEELEPAARTKEIGRMLSGAQLTPEALKHAEQLIRLSRAG